MVRYEVRSTTVKKQVPVQTDTKSSDQNRTAISEASARDANSIRILRGLLLGAPSLKADVSLFSLVYVRTMLNNNDK